MRRREFMAGLGSVAAWPVVARAQQGCVRRIGLLIGLEENDPLGNARIFAFRQALAELGWTDGGKVQVDVRWTGGDADRTRALAEELVGSQPDAILPDSNAKGKGGA